MDGYGRTRVFHGMDTVVKLPPFLPSVDGFDAMTSLSKEDLDLMYSMGVTTLRMNVPWEAVEPVQGAYNETWLDGLEALIDTVYSYNIQVLLDMHQDAMSRRFCGTGFPSWATIVPEEWDNFPRPLQKQAFSNTSDPSWVPSRAQCDSIDGNNFPAYYVSFAESTAWGLFYNSTTLTAAFASFWAHVAARFADHPGVIAYELMNEPFSGNVYKNILLWVPPTADNWNMQPLYDQTAYAMRAVDPYKLIAFESVTWEVFGLGSKFGFKHAPGGAQWANRSVLSFHNSVFSSLTPDPKYYELRLFEAQRLGVAAWVTETGSDQQLLLADQYMLTWMHWDYKWYSNWTWDNSGLFTASPNGWEPCADRTNITACLVPSSAQFYARPYPYAVAGQVLSFFFNTTSVEAELVYVPSAGALASGAPTQLYVSQSWWFTGGVSVSVDPPGAATWAAVSKDWLNVTATAQGVGQNVTVRLTSAARDGQLWA